MFSHLGRTGPLGMPTLFFQHLVDLLVDGGCTPVIGEGKQC